MKYDFDTIIDRYDTGSLKYDFIKERGKPEGTLPLWVADMDFMTPPCVVNALIEKTDMEFSVTRKAKKIILKFYRIGFLVASNGKSNPNGL